MPNMDNPKTKIVATLGPACATLREVLPQASGSGSFGCCGSIFPTATNEDRLAILKVVRACVGDKPIAIMGDLCGPKIRVGTVDAGGMPLHVGDSLTIQREPIVGKNLTISCSYACLVDDLEIGQRILIDDGAIHMIVAEKQSNVKQLPGNAWRRPVAKQ